MKRMKDNCIKCGVPSDKRMNAYMNYEWDYDWWFCDNCAYIKEALISESRHKTLIKFVMRDEDKINGCPKCNPKYFVIYGYCVYCNRKCHPPLIDNEDPNWKEKLKENELWIQEPYLFNQNVSSDQQPTS